MSNSLGPVLTGRGNKRLPYGGGLSNYDTRTTQGNEDEVKKD
jgi:hypothetical protein